MIHNFWITSNHGSKFLKNPLYRTILFLFLITWKHSSGVNFQSHGHPDSKIVQLLGWSISEADVGKTKGADLSPTARHLHPKTIPWPGLFPCRLSSLNTWDRSGGFWHCWWWNFLGTLVDVFAEWVVCLHFIKCGCAALFLHVHLCAIDIAWMRSPLRASKIGSVF